MNGTLEYARFPELSKSKLTQNNVLNKHINKHNNIINIFTYANLLYFISPTLNILFDQGGVGMSRWLIGQVTYCGCTVTKPEVGCSL